MITKLVLAALVTTFALPTLAQDIPQGRIMLAQIEGVRPESLSTVELAQLSAARSSDGDSYTADYILANADGATASRASSASDDFIGSGRAQLARQLGVDPSDFSLSQLVRLIDAASDNDETTIRAIVAVSGADVSPGSLLR